MSIRQIQCILLKICLLLGVEVFEGTGYEDLIEPTDAETGWRAKVSPADHPVSQYEFDVMIGADGKRNTLTGFKRKEFRGKLAIAITATSSTNTLTLRKAWRRSQAWPLSSTRSFSMISTTSWG